MKASIRLVGTIAALGALAACGRPSAVTDDLQRDLEQASSATVELAPNAPRTAVVSALELGEAEPPKVEAPKATPAPRAPQRAKAAAQTRRAPVQRVAVREPEPEPEMQPVAEAPAVIAEAPAPVETPAPPVVRAPTPLPIPAPSRAPARRNGNGGWWSTGDVIRNAPFPINP